MLEETPFYLLVTIDTKYYFKQYVAFIKSLGGQFDWNTKKWKVDKCYKQQVMEHLHITFTENELRQGDLEFEHWFASLFGQELSLFETAI